MVPLKKYFFFFCFVDILGEGFSTWFQFALWAWLRLCIECTAMWPTTGVPAAYVQTGWTATKPICVRWCVVGMIFFFFIILWNNILKEFYLFIKLIIVEWLMTGFFRVDVQWMMHRSCAHWINQAIYVWEFNLIGGKAQLSAWSIIRI